MAVPTLSALFTIKTEEIDKEVAKISAGVYALDATSDSGFTFSYVGRSDDNVAKRLNANSITRSSPRIISTIPTGRTDQDGNALVARRLISSQRIST